MPFFVTEPLTAEKAQKIEGIVRVKTWERGLFFQQRSAWRVVALLCGLLVAGFGFSWVKTKNRCFFKLPRKHFLFTKFYGILRKTFDIARSRNAQGRFWISRRDDPLWDFIFVYCVVDFDHLFRLFESSPDGFVHHRMMAIT